MTDKAARTGAEIRLPRVGSIFVSTAITTAVTIDLAAQGPQNQSANTTGAMPVPGLQTQPVQGPTNQGTVSTAGLASGGFEGFWVDIMVDGADVGIISGPTSASVSSGNAPVLATTGGAGTAGVCQRLLAGTRNPFFVTPDDRFLGVVSSGTTTLRIALSSR